MFHRILTLIKKDWGEFWLSKSWIIVLMMPLFIGFLYLVVYREAESKKFTAAYTPNLDRGFIRIISNTGINLKPFPNLAKAKTALEKGKVEGVIFGDKLNPEKISLIVDKTRTQEAILLMNSINLALINYTTSKDSPHLEIVYLNKTIPDRWLSFPVWLLQIILTICLLQATAAIADEKEKQTLHSLLISPMSFQDYLVSKIGWYTFITIGALFLTILITKAPSNLWYVLAYGLTGSMAFTAIALLIGLMTPTALFARTTATLIYIVSALPIMVRDLNFAWKKSLDLFPSYLVLKGLEQAIFHKSNQLEVLFLVGGLLLQTMIILGIILITLRKRADF